MKRRGGPTPPRPWEPLRYSHTAENGGRVYGNGRYTVTLHEMTADDDPNAPTMTVLGIHTRTRSTVGAHDWRHFQRIKNELTDPERWAVEVYPEESTLVDTANEYWLWVFPLGFPRGFGFHEREVSGPNPAPHETAWRQRRTEAG